MSKDMTREERLAAKLRENLHRRKEQGRKAQGRKEQARAQLAKDTDINAQDGERGETLPKPGPDR